MVPTMVVCIVHNQGDASEEKLPSIAAERSCADAPYGPYLDAPDEFQRETSPESGPSVGKTHSKETTSSAASSLVEKGRGISKESGRISVTSVLTTSTSSSIASAAKKVKNSFNEGRKVWQKVTDGWDHNVSCA
eukprot:gnl/TRDRNA2_/TRDRNA2_137468_c2_seq1.p1 gnl/TRDRNA2_/TRDRNA2_137468_c2~~gnl/TRDRNA2_/TRDRNA2_137468_c2_seq1.p1  ORF type:complete len:134 (+),score=28.91 gnl/TRDRNA2_/TRDRNA2_137468_c2_seq1:82-483(+)